MSPQPDTHCRHLSLASADCPSVASLVSLLESIPALLWETDSDLRITTLTGAALRIANLSRARYEGQSIEQLFPLVPNGRKARRAHEAALAGQTNSFEADVNGRDLRATVKPLRDADGRVAGVMGIALDMTDRMVAERALRISEHSYRSLIEEAPYAICRCTMAGDLLQANRAMAEMLAYDSSAASELLLRDLGSIFTPTASFDDFLQTLSGEGPHPPRDAVWVRRDGSHIQVRLSGRVVRGVSGAVSHLDIFAENVTEKKQLEAELSQAQKMHAIGQLAGGVAHDFNNLLTVIIGHVGMLLSDGQDEASRESLEAVQGSAERAAALTKQPLAFSRRQMLRSQTVNLNEVIRTLMGMLSRVIKENIQLVFIPGNDLGSIRADPNEIERVLLNLAMNAQDAMPAGGVLTIETANVRPDASLIPQPDELKAREYVQIVVRDTGFGMDRETQARVFEPFFTTKQPNEGTGLGLSVVYGVVRQSGGYIRLESAPGSGATFRIFLPRVPSDPKPETSTAREASPHGTETILFAEDDAAIRRLVTGYLEGLGYRVLSAEDGVAALKLANSWKGEIHLLLTDFVMPTVGGRELAVRLREADPGLKVVFISGYAGHSVTERDLNSADGHFLQKPFSMDALARIVRGALDGDL
jgi:PAS domain S-box-containing protein